MNKFNSNFLIIFCIGGVRQQQQQQPQGGKPRGGNRQTAKPVSAEELDAELDAYVNDMKI